MPRRLSLLLIAPLTAALAVSAAGAASAATGRFRDPGGDAIARYDLTKWQVSNRDTLVITSHVRNLKGSAAQIFVVNIRTRHDDTAWIMTTVRRANGSTTGSLNGYRHDGSIIASHCTVRRSWGIRKDVVTLAVPRNCLADPGPVSVSVAIGAGNGSAGDPADWTGTVHVPEG